MLDKNVLQILKGTEDRNPTTDYFSEWDFKTGTDGYVRDTAGTWQLCVYIVQANQLVSGTPRATFLKNS